MSQPSTIILSTAKFFLRFSVSLTCSPITNKQIEHLAMIRVSENRSDVRLQVMLQPRSPSSFSCISMLLWIFEIVKTKTGSYNRSQQDALFLNFILIYNSICFGQTYSPSSGVLILYSQQSVFVILVDKYHLLWIQYQDSWWWTVSLSETYRVLYQNKVKKYCILLVSITWIYHDARPLECQRRLIVDIYKVKRRKFQIY